MNRTLKRTLMDVRKMRRAVKLRGETDPEVVSQTLEAILKEAIVLTKSGEGAMSDAAIKEIQQVRRALVAGHIDAGGKTTAMIGRFSAVLDQINDVSTEVNEKYEDDDSIKNVSSRILENLPSADTIIAGIMTANPLLGYTVKMARDMLSDTGNANKKKRKEELRLRKERLEAQERVIAEQLQSEELAQTNEKNKKENITEEKKQLTNSRRGIYKKVLEEIRDELKDLKNVERHRKARPFVVPVVATKNDYTSVFSSISDKLKGVEKGQDYNVSEKVDSVFSETDYKELDRKEQSIYKESSTQNKNFYNSAMQAEEVIMKFDSSSISEVEKILSSANNELVEKTINSTLDNSEYIEKVSSKEGGFSSKENSNQSILQSFIDSVFTVEKVSENNTVEKIDSSTTKQMSADKSNTNMIVEKLDSIDSKTDSSNIQLEKISDINSKELALKRSEAASAGLEEAETAFETVNNKDKKNPSMISNMVDTVKDTMMDGLSFFGGLAKSGIFKLLAGLKIAAFVTVIKGIYDFVDGIFRAGEILGVDNNSLDFKERLVAGFSHMLSGILEPINFIYEFFGGNDLFNGETRDGLTKRYFDFFNNFTENMFGMIKWIFDSIVEKIVEFGEAIIDYITPDFSKFIPDWLGGDDKSSDSNLIKEKESIMPTWLPSWLGGDSKSEENNISDSNTNSVNNKTELNQNANTNKVTISESESPSMKYTSTVANDFENLEERNVDNTSKQNSTAIVAPVSNNQTNINQHHYSGSGSSENREPSHRRFSRNNSSYAY